MDAIEAVLEDLKLQDKKNISAVAKLHGVQRSTVSRRWNGVTNPAKVKDLVQYIKLTENGIPPTPPMVRNFARDIAGKRPGRDWSQRFCKRHKDVLSGGYLTNIDRKRKDANIVPEYEYYFTLAKHMIKQYDVQPQNMYNIDEKAFSLGTMTKQYRISTKDAH
jgi:hypothetical protein